MADFSAVALAAAATILPLYLALVLGKSSSVRRHSHVMILLALGMSLVFLLDPLQDTNGLGLYSRPFSPSDILLVSAFSATFLVLAYAGSERNGWPAWVFATAIGIHSLSETYALVGTVPTYFGGLASTIPSAVSFLLHKFIEGFVIVGYTASLGVQRVKEYLMAGLPVAVFSIAGGVAALIAQVDLTPFLAAAAGGWLLALVALAFQLPGGNRPKTALFCLVGFVIVYSVGLLHSL